MLNNNLNKEILEKYQTSWRHSLLSSLSWRHKCLALALKKAHIKVFAFT